LGRIQKLKAIKVAIVAIAGFCVSNTSHQIGDRVFTFGEISYPVPVCIYSFWNCSTKSDHILLVGCGRRCIATTPFDTIITSTARVLTLSIGKHVPSRDSMVIAIVAATLLDLEAERINSTQHEVPLIDRHPIDVPKRILARELSSLRIVVSGPEVQIKPIGMLS
jgi:hypothetical protein